MKMQLLSILILLPFLAVAQQNEIYAVKFDFHHSLRIPDNNVSVYFERYGDSINVSVKSIPMDTISQEWKESKRMYSFGLSLTEFQTVFATIKKINCTDIINGLDYWGHHGTVCEIEIGGIGSGITYKVWSPNYETKDRNLEAFLDACKLILATAKLDPEKIL